MCVVLFVCGGVLFVFKIICWFNLGWLFLVVVGW